MGWDGQSEQSLRMVADENVILYSPALVHRESARDEVLRHVRPPSFTSIDWSSMLTAQTAANA